MMKAECIRNYISKCLRNEGHCFEKEGVFVPVNIDRQLRELQLSELDILLEFRRICQKHDLNYFLTAGTLLGAVRHKGFIPWDDDIDVMMPRQDFDKLARICQTELGENYFFQDETSDPNYPFYFAKIRKNNTQVIEPALAEISMHHGQYIDIFPLDRCPSNKYVAIIFFKAMELLGCAIMAHVNPRFTCGYKKKIMKVAFRIIKTFSVKKIRFFRDGLRKIVERYASQQYYCTVSGQHGYPKETQKKEWLESRVLMAFEQHNFFVPIGWDALLHNMYGDYIVVPSEEERKGHFKEG